MFGMAFSNTINPIDPVAYKEISMREGITLLRTYDLLMIPHANLQIPASSLKRAVPGIRVIVKDSIPEPCGRGMLIGFLEIEKPAVLAGNACLQ